MYQKEFEQIARLHGIDTATTGNGEYVSAQAATAWRLWVAGVSTAHDKLAVGTTQATHQLLGATRLCGFNDLSACAFDCFGTIFDMTDFPKELLKDYVEHVRRADFTEFEFPEPWWELRAHEQVDGAIAMLQGDGLKCVTLSNGSQKLLQHLSEANGIEWDAIIDLAAHRAYKPNNLRAYQLPAEILGVPPREILMVTANPTFGDLEGAAAAGMRAVTISHEFDGFSLWDLVASVSVIDE